MITTRSETRPSAPRGSEEPPARYEAHTAVAVLCGELAHEVAPTLAFLRDLVRGRVLPEVDHSIAQEEVARLESVVASLRRTKRAEEAVVPIELAPLAARAAARACDDVPGTMRVMVDVPRDLFVTASERGLELVLVSLLRNALHATRRGPVVLRARPEGDAWCVDVEDDGVGLSEGLGDRLFMPLTTLGPAGRGIGVPTVLRIVRDHGWEIAHVRRAERTVFTVLFNPGDARPASQS